MTTNCWARGAAPTAGPLARTWGYVSEATVSVTRLCLCQRSPLGGGLWTSGGQVPGAPGQCVGTSLPFFSESSPPVPSTFSGPQPAGCRARQALSLSLDHGSVLGCKGQSRGVTGWGQRGMPMCQRTGSASSPPTSLWLWPLWPALCRENPKLFLFPLLIGFPAVCPRE